MAGPLIKDRLERSATREFVGREAEIAVLLDMFRADGPLAVMVHGIGGIGKSALLRRFAHIARERGHTAIELDGRQIEPTESGFLGELRAAIGGKCTDPAAAARRLEQLPGPVVLVIDAYEVLRLLDTWLRRTFLPALPANTRVVLAGRERPVSGWLTDPGWQGAFNEVRLPALEEEAVVELLGGLGIDEADARRLNQIMPGHPLALKLGAGAFRDSRDFGRAAERTIDELTRRYLNAIPDAATRAAIEAVSVVRRVTVPTLAALLPDLAPEDIYARLHALPFVEGTRDGMMVHDAVREVIAASLRSSDPPRYRALRHAAWRTLNAELDAAGANDLWRYAADMLYLTENPVIREAFFPSDYQPLAVEPAHHGDAESVRRIAQRRDGPQSAAQLERWWHDMPRSFHVVRDQSGDVVGFYCCFDAGLAPRGALAGDPVVAPMLRHLADSPLPPGQRALILRKWLSRDSGEAPSPVQAACWLDVKRTYIEMRRTLRRVYTAAWDSEPYAAVLPVLGFTTLKGEATLDGRAHALVALDFGPDLVLGWMSGIVGAELGLANASILDDDTRELTAGGRRMPLTALEFKVMRYLDAREGRAVPRDDMLVDVWGITYDGASNVVDVVIRALRKKLGPAADAIETVRGVGYRFNRPP